jgi:hypothetical protein
MCAERAPAKNEIAAIITTATPTAFIPSALAKSLPVITQYLPAAFQVFAFGACE